MAPACPPGSRPHSRSSCLYRYNVAAGEDVWGDGVCVRWREERRRGKRDMSRKKGRRNKIQARKRGSEDKLIFSIFGQIVLWEKLCSFRDVFFGQLSLFLSLFRPKRPSLLQFLLQLRESEEYVKEFGDVNPYGQPTERVANMLRRMKVNDHRRTLPNQRLSSSCREEMAILFHFLASFSLNHFSLSLSSCVR